VLLVDGAARFNSRRGQARSCRCPA